MLLARLHPLVVEMRVQHPQLQLGLGEHPEDRRLAGAGQLGVPARTTWSGMPTLVRTCKLNTHCINTVLLVSLKHLFTCCFDSLLLVPFGFGGRGLNQTHSETNAFRCPGRRQPKTSVGFELHLLRIE